MTKALKWICIAMLGLLTMSILILFTTPLGARLRITPAIGAGYAAQFGCAGIFVTGRDLAQVLKDDILPVNPILSYAKISADREAGTVTANLFGIAEKTAMFRPGLGCTLVGQGGVAALREQAKTVTPIVIRERPEKWPVGDQVETSEWPSLTAALDAAMQGGGGIESRALLVIHNGHVVGERYGQGFGPTSRMLGWSMSKSVTAALIGTQIAKGKLSLDRPAPVPEWQAESDPRHGIALRHLLTMTSGLDFKEIYQPGDDVTKMLYVEEDMGRFAASQKLVYQPGQSWAYSSGTANIVARILFDSAGGTLAGAYNLARTQLFEPAGMTSALFEPDASGVPVGSSNLYMTPRDWARFGLLYLNDGLLGWQRLLPESWIAATRQPITTADGKHIAYDDMFWLNSDGAGKLVWPHCPPDAYWADGHNGQLVAIIPSAHSVIVRMGWDTGPASFDRDRHVAAILAALAAGN